MTMVQAIGDKITWRVRFLREARGFTLAERLSCVVPRMGVRRIGDLLLRRLRTAPDGTPYFEIDGDRIHFVPDHPVADRDAMVEGALTILEEVYARASEFFSPPVAIRPGDVVLDLGGNFGTSALSFARRTGPDGHVWSFEPVFHAPLRRTLEANGIANATVVPYAVGDAPGEMDFYTTDIGINSRLSRDPREGRRQRVPVTSLDAFAREKGLDRVDFIKADIEGAEELAIRGAAELVARFRPKWSVASYHTDLDGDPQHPKLVRLFRDLGYTVRTVEGHHIYAW